MAVILEAAGDHSFDLRNLKAQGAADLVSLLITNAGLDEKRTWRLQVQKKIVVGPHTSPIRVVDGPKLWCIYVKIKPGNNDTGHYCSLIVPEGISANDIYPRLSREAFTIPKNWRKVRSDKMTETNRMTPQEPVAQVPAALEPATQEPVAEVPVAQEVAPEPVVTDLKGWVNDFDKQRRILMAIYNVQDVYFKGPEHFATTIAERLQITGASRHQLAGLFSSLIRKKFLKERLRGKTRIAYDLTQEGLLVISDLIHQEPVKPPIDPIKVIFDFSEQAKRFVEANDKLQENRKLYEHCMEEIRNAQALMTKLDEEARQIIEMFPEGICEFVEKLTKK